MDLDGATKGFTPLCTPSPPTIQPRRALFESKLKPRVTDRLREKERVDPVPVLWSKDHTPSYSYLPNNSPISHRYFSHLFTRCSPPTYS